jgi:hypothetical protein
VIAIGAAPGGDALVRYFLSSPYARLRSSLAGA